MDSFVHFNTQTSASFGRSLLRPEKLIERCQNLAQPAVALCDHNNAFLAMRFTNSARKAGIQPIHGARISIDCRELASQWGLPSQSHVDDLTLTLGVVVATQDGWRSLCHLLTRGWVDGRENKYFTLTWEEFRSHSKGLILLDGGCDGLAGHPALKNNPEALLSATETLASTFNDRYYIELNRQTPDDHAIEPERIDAAHKFGLPVLASHRVRFLSQGDHKAHEILQCIVQHYKIQDDAHPRSYPDQTYCSGDDMRGRFHDLPEACDNTVDLAQRVHFALDSAAKISFPKFPKLGKRDASELLQELTQKGLDKRLEKEIYPSCIHDAEKNTRRDLYQKRLEKELSVIRTVGYEGYFLIVADFVDFARSQSIPVGLGRGSAAGSLVSWTLEITNIDPIAHDLLFERFINPDRLSPPDIDIDFCQDRRDEVIRYVQKQYGDRHVAHIITFGRMQARAVTRDVGRVLGLPYSAVDRIVRLLPENLALSNMGLKDVLRPGSSVASPDLLQEYTTNPETRRLLNYAVQLEGLYRNASMHAAGIVISDDPLDENIPLYSDPESAMLVTQFDMDDIAAAGMLKFDFLGLTTLSIIHSTQTTLHKRGIFCPLAKIPLDDDATYAMLQADRVMGVFQLESDGMRRVIRDLQPDNVSEIIALVALFRPGPMRNIQHFVDRKHGREEIEYPHPLLESILQETYGIAVYQEQVMRIAQILAGFTLQEADLMRQAMGKKIVGKINALKQPFIDGAQRNKIEPKAAIAIFDALKEFANYGFNKSHAAAYGITSYYTAYLKCHYPAEYLASCMNYSFNDGHRLSLLVREVRTSGLAVHPPDLNQSGVKFSVSADGKSLRYGLGAIKNVGRAMCEEIIKERDTNGPFSSIEDAFRRIPHDAVNARGMESLIDANTFSELHADPRSLSIALPKLLKFQQQCQTVRHGPQQSLFGETEMFPFPKFDPDWNVPDPDYDPAEKDLRSFGFYFTRHPLDAYRDMIEKRNIISSRDLDAHLKESANSFELAGIPVKLRTLPMRRNRVMRVLTCSDWDGPFEVAIFAEHWSEELGMRIASEVPGILTVAPRVVNQNRTGSQGSRRLNLLRFEPLKRHNPVSYREITIYARFQGFNPEALHSLLKMHSGNIRHDVSLVLVDDDGRRLYFEDKDHTYSLSPRFQGALNALPGIVEVIYQ